MKNETIIIKVQQRLNKLSSHDYDNIEQWQIVEAFNKAQLDWCRRNLHGMNQFKEGDEQSKRRIDDFQILLKDVVMDTTRHKIYDETNELPSDYLEYKRVSCSGVSECCKNKHAMMVYLAEESNVNILLRDENKKPNFSWGETFCTLIDNRIRVYTNDEFSTDNVVLTYYRMPKRIQRAGQVDPYKMETVDAEVTCEFKDDIVEVLIDETVKIIAGDIENFNTQSTSNVSVETNN